MYALCIYSCINCAICRTEFSLQTSRSVLQIWKVKNTLLATNSFMLLSLFHKTVSSTAHVYMFQTLKKLAQGNGNAILFSSCHCLYCCHHSRGMIEHHPLIVSVLSWHLRWSCPSWKDHPPHLWQMEQVLPVACFCLFLRSPCLVQTWMIK